MDELHEVAANTDNNLIRVLIYLLSGSITVIIGGFFLVMKMFIKIAKKNTAIIKCKDELIEKKNEQVVTLAKELVVTSTNASNAISILVAEQKEFIRKADGVLKN